MDNENQKHSFPPRPERRAISELFRCKTLDDFKELGRLRGYKQSWAYIKWNERKACLLANGYPIPEEQVA